MLFVRHIQSVRESCCTCYMYSVPHITTYILNIGNVGDAYRVAKPLVGFHFVRPFTTYYYMY